MAAVVPAQPRPPQQGGGGRGRVILVGLLALAALVFCGLGIWQVERRSWKLDLIARVEARLRAAPQPAPGPQGWTGLTEARDAYRRVVLTGRFLDAAPALSLAVTERGSGFWLLAPFRDERGFTVLVNRGFVADAEAARWRSGGVPLPPPGRLTGLLRMSESGGGFLRRNDPAGDRWYSRDVGAIAEARGLGSVAPYFVDADAASEPGPVPQGGLTVVAFRNSHLVYALTWFALAAMSLWGAVFVWRSAGAGRRGG